MLLHKLKESVQKYEGFSSKPYVCPRGKLTIGYGLNLYDRGISEVEAFMLMSNDLSEINVILEKKLDFYKYLTDARQNVLIEMAYMMGVDKLLTFKNTLEYLKNKDYEKASEEMLNSKWHRQLVEYDMLDNKKSKEPLRSEYLSNLLREGKY